MGVQIIIPDARLSYPTLGVPKPYQDKPENKPRWGAGLWVPKTDLKTIAMIDQTIRDVAKDKWPKGWEKILEEVLLDKKGCCWIDGKRRNEDEAEDFWTLTAYRDHEKGPPLVLDKDMSPIYTTERAFNPGKAGVLYAGARVKAKVEIWAQENAKGGKGMRAGLLVVQKIGDAASFGGGAAPTNEGFDAVEDGADADDMSA